MLRCEGCERFHGWLSLDAAIELGLYELER